MELKNYFAQDDAGNILPNAICYLYDRGTEILVKNLKAADGTALVNPFTADDKGQVSFAAANGLYDLRITKGARDSRIRVQCLDVTEHVNRMIDNPAPKDSPYLAKGDGVTNDTAAFTAFEAVIKGRQVDLGGSKYLVDKIPTKNIYTNGSFKVGAFTRQASLFNSFVSQPPYVHRFGGQLSKLKASLGNPLEQITSIVFIGDSITWGSGNGTEQGPTEPRDRTLSDPRDWFGTGSYVNVFKRYIGERYAFGADPVLSNWPASPSGESTVEYTVPVTLFPRGGAFTLTTVGPSMSSTVALTAGGAVTGAQYQLADGNNLGTSSHTISFRFTGTGFTLSFGVVGDSLDYELIVDGVSQGVFTTSEGEDGLTYGNDRRRAHTFGYIRDKVVELRTKRRASQSTGSKVFRPEAILINKKIRITNQGINGASSRTYRSYNLPPTGAGFGDGVAVGTQDNYVFCQIGTNDRIRSVQFASGVNEYAYNLGLLVDVLQPMADVILMCANPAADESPETFSFTMQDVRGTIYRAAQSRKLDMIDNYTALSAVDINVLANDGLHPNSLGYSLMARNIVNSLESA